ncbi:MAG TPA: glycoside hydrolase family 44 protein, partial [Polyangia bacterium]
VPGIAMEGALATADTGLISTLVTGQLGDYVAADKKGGGDVTTAADYLTTRFKKNVLNKPTPLATTPDVTDDSVYQDEFLGWVQSAHAKSKVLIALDNEPDLWDATHKEIWPNGVTYDDFIKRDVAYAKMARKAFAKAELLGYASYGWYGWTTFQDKYKSGNFLNYYLDKMKAAEADVGGRVIDYLDVHWYPEARAVSSDAKTRVTSGGTSDGEIKAREQAPRSLWDTSYVETSWIADGLKSEPNKGAIALIPRLKKQIADHYAGTKLAFAEWNYGADADISGGIATADVLGIFGRESVDLACNWLANPDSYFRDGAYQIFGNYDSKGAHFGDTSVNATPADVALTSIYAAKDSADAKRLTIVAINKDTAPHLAKISIKGDTKYKSAVVYVLSAAAQDTYNKTAHPQLAAAVTTTTDNELSVPLPAQSVAMIVPSTDATAPTGMSWPKPAVVTETGWTFDKDKEGWTLEEAQLKPATLAAKLDWNATEGKPKAGSLSLEIPFTGRSQQAQITMGDQNLDLTGKKLQMNVRRKGAFDGGIMFFAGSASEKSWTPAGWTLVPNEEWMTIVFDPIAAKTMNPDFDPTAVTYLGAIFSTGDKGDTTPGTVTFYIDQIVVASTK